MTNISSNTIEDNIFNRNKAITNPRKKKKNQKNKEHEQFIREVRMVNYIKMYSNSGFIKEPATETIINHCMWWLILFVNLTGPWVAQIFGQILFCLCLWGCFWMRLVFKLVDKQSKVDCFPLWEFFLPDGLWTGTLAFFLPSDTNWNTTSSEVSSLPASEVELHDELS